LKIDPEDRDEESTMLKRLGMVMALVGALAFPLACWAQQGAAKPEAPAATESKADSVHQHGQGHQHGHEMEGAHADGHGAGHGMQGGGQHGRMRQCMAMKEKSDQAMADMKAMDARLDEMVSAMKKAKPNEKTAAMEALLAELVSQRKAMRESLGDVHHRQAMCGMMGKGGQHGKMAHGGKGMHPNCPMMGGTGQGSGGQGDQAKPETQN
jgi:hypothetical protein